MLRITLVFSVCLVLGGGALANPPNIVLFVADDLGVDLGCYGNLLVQTPHVDGLARRGVRFVNAFCTTASCSPSRSVILTGQFNHATGQFGLAHDYHHFVSFDTVRSLPQRIADLGYRTARIGKFHLLPESAYLFQTVIPGPPRNGVAMAENCRAWMEQSEQPFFLYFCTADPHRGGGVSPAEPHRPDRFGNRDEGYPGVQGVSYDPADIEIPPFLPDTDTCRSELAQYYQSVSRVDQGLGKLLQILQETGAADNTIVIFTSDHGIAFPGAKTTVYDPGLRVPLIIFDPRRERRGHANQALVSLVDLVPTILELAGGTTPDRSLQGRSLAAILTQSEPVGWDEVFASHTFHEVTMYYPMRAVRTRDFKLIWNLAHPLPFPFASDLWNSATWQDVYAQGLDAAYGRRTVDQYLHRPEFELYDLHRDPHEVRNLAGEPDYQAKLTQLQERIRVFQHRTGDPWILKWERE